MVFADIIKKVFPTLTQYVYIDTRIPIDDAVMADLFESIFGALFLASESRFRGIGFHNCQRLLANIFNRWLLIQDPTGKSGFDIRYAAGSLKTQIVQSFTRNGIPAPAERDIPVFRNFIDEFGKRQTVKDISRTHIQVILGPEQVNFLSKFNARRNDRLLTPVTFDGEGRLIGEASNDAYDKAYNWLAQVQIDSPIRGRVFFSLRWAEEVKSEKDLKFFPREYLDPLEAKMKADGYSQVIFRALRKHKEEGNRFAIILRGYADGVEKFLSLGVSSGNHVRARRDAIEKYIGTVIISNWEYSAATDHLPQVVKSGAGRKTKQSRRGF
jgi:hypothetical protein